MFCLENHVCLSRGVQVAGATWCAAMRIVTGVGDLVQSGRAIERSDDAVCGQHCAREDEKRRFLG
jgi:hypothetical protein